MLRCPACQAETAPPLLHVRAAALHTSPLREWIHLLKYRQRPDLAAPLARYLVAALYQPEWKGFLGRIDGVAPVPLHEQRQRERGYNQAELLARELCRRLGLTLRSDLLRRARFTRAQVQLSAAERQANVQGAFGASPACAGLHLLLIDDVFTTGATLRACASAARAAGAATVCALTLAMPVHFEMG